MASWLYIYSFVREIILWKGCLAADLDSLARDKTLWLSMWCFSCHDLKELSCVTSILEHSLTWLQVHINCEAHFQVYQRINQLKSKYFGLVGRGSYCTSVHVNSNGLSLLTDFFWATHRNLNILFLCYKAKHIIMSDTLKLWGHLCNLNIDYLLGYY